jgi:hypothetical protein
LLATVGDLEAELEVPTPRPNLVFLPPDTKEFVSLSNGRTGHFLVFAIANDPDDPNLGEDAEPSSISFRYAGRCLTVRWW